MAIFAAVQAVQDLMIAVTGIKTAPDYPGPGVFPMVITHLGTGEIIPGDPAGSVKSLDNIVIELHVADQGLTAAFTTLETLHPLVLAKLTADVTLTSTVQTYESISYATTRSEWDGAPTLVRIYTLNNCKIIA